MSIIQSKHFIHSLPTLVRNPKRLLSDKRLLADAVPLATFLAPVGPLIFSPLLVDFESKKKKASKEERKKMVLGELVGQLLTVGIHFSSFLLGGYIAKRSLPKLNPNYFKPGKSALENAQTLACITSAFFGITFIRPLITTKVLKDQDHQKQRSTTTQVNGRIFST
jgi:hypothetical protein